MLYFLTKRRLYRYRVYLSEVSDEKLMPEIAFECDAEDGLHAMELASDAYPGCRLNWTKSHLIDESETA
ncbi:hypothetical protein [Pseudomonas triclosanedens]|uniref:hypothetical protein n=1 Tax=Pseudomonas triclosanedens TaxID=2961893 RepID=UPI0020C431CC|nr:hypothetical protein [Pseudomonas triclosanedens]MCP8473826.1 hypothetical protein [Pseudomonas triclosanedens]